MKKMSRIAAFIIALSVFFDQLSKLLIRLLIPYEGAATKTYEVIANFLYITHRRNAGAAFGILQGQQIMFIIITIVALVIFIYMMKDSDFKTKRFYSWGLTLLIGGTIGNFIDRIRLGYVTDFVDTYIFGWDFAVFNVADSCLTIGIILLAIDLIILDSRREKKLEEKNV